MTRSSLVLTLALMTLATVALAACEADARDPVIPSGAHVAGVEVGGLPLSLAAERIEAAFGDRLDEPIRVRAAGHRRSLTVERAGIRFDPLRSARRANIAARRAADPTTVDVQPWVSYDEQGVRAFVAQVARPVARRPRDARLRFAVTRLLVRSGRAGYDIDRTGLRKRIAAALTDPREPRVLRAARQTIRPEVTRREMLRRTVVTIHRRRFRLRVFKRGKRVASYAVAVGMPDHATPRGRYRIANKAVNPAWSAPDKPWAGAYRGEVIAGGAAANPLKSRWLGIVNGVGIHGTAATWSLGSRASHGCIRMSVPAVERVYRLVPVGAAVMIK